jgi:hypothetical protein
MRTGRISGAKLVFHKTKKVVAANSVSPSSSWSKPPVSSPEPRLCRNRESAPEGTKLTDLESFFRLVDASGFLNCQAKIRQSYNKDVRGHSHAVVVPMFTFP